MKLLLLGLQVSDCKIRQIFASTISSIAFFNWPSISPDLFDTLLDYLRGKSEFAKDGAMRVLCESFRCGGEFESAVIDLEILQKMLLIFEAEDEYSVGIRSWAAKIFGNIVNRCDTTFVRDYLQQTIPLFSKKFIQYLSEENVPSNDIYDFKTNIVEAITNVTTEVPKCISDFLPQILPLIWKILIESTKVYQPDDVNEESDVENEDTDSNGEIINHYDDLVKAVLRFISALMDRLRGRNISVRHPEYDILNYQWSYLQASIPPEVLHHLILFMQITDKKIQLWHEPREFLMSETVRNYPDDLRSESHEIAIDSILTSPTRTTADVLVIVILKQMEIENVRRINRISEVNRDSWKMREALLFAFCLARDNIVSRQKEGTLHFDIVAFFENVVLADLDNSESHPLLIARCLCVGGLYVEQMTLSMASRFLTATVNGLQNGSFCTKICAVIAAERWFQTTSIVGNEGYKEILGSHLPALFQALFDLGSQTRLHEDIFTLVMESLYPLTLFHKAFTTSVLSQFYKLTVTVCPTLKCYGRTRSLCKFFVKKFLQDPKYAGQLQTVLVPKIAERNDFELMDIFMRYSRQPLNRLLIKNFLPAACKYILEYGTQKYREFLEDRGKLLCTYLMLAAEQVMGYKDEHGKTGQQYILQAAAQLLNPESKDSETLVACEIVTLLIQKSGNKLRVDGSDIQQLLPALFKKLETTQKPSVHCRNLLMVWAHLINTQNDSVLNFLSMPRGKAGQAGGKAKGNGGIITIQQRFCREYTYFEDNERQTVTRALGKILEYGLTHAEFVLHDLVTEGETGASIPLLVQICRVITAQLPSDELYKALETGSEFA